MKIEPERVKLKKSSLLEAVARKQTNKGTASWKKA
jgi:hypothetical protein